MGLLDGKVAVVTGGASGIGAETARLFAQEGARVMLGDLLAEQGQALVQEIDGLGAEAAFLPTDVSQAIDVAALIAATIERWGGIDLLFNNAGIAPERHLLAENPVELFDQVLAVNLRGPFLGMHYAIPHMIERGGGSIICTSSTAARVGHKRYAGYGASKAGVLGLVRVAAVEYAASNIRVNAILPGIIATPMGLADPWLRAATPDEQIATLARSQPLPRAGRPRDIAGVALWLASDLSAWVTGQEIVADGGYLADSHRDP
jgi:NAD(P)-dependent dehydrogenase (short-subunit alcohol dehydrogenase family)